MTRPTLTPNISADEFDSYYWYKDELIEFAKLLKLSYSGGKFAIHDRISDYLRGGVIVNEKAHTTLSNFDWTHEALTRTTVITDNYRNTKNVRRFLEDELKEKFCFSITTMDWMKSNIGKTLGEFLHCYPELKKQRKQQKIPEHNQFNRYVRDFLTDNRDLSKEDAVKAWKKAIEIPRPGSKGRGILYCRTHLKL